MAAGGGDLECALRAVLTNDFAEVSAIDVGEGFARTLGRQQRTRLEPLHELTDRCRCAQRQIADEARFGYVRARQDKRVLATIALQPPRDREHTSHRADAAIQTPEQIGSYFILEWRGKRRQILYRPDDE